MLQNKKQCRYKNLIDLINKMKAKTRTSHSRFNQSHVTQMFEYDNIPPGQISRQKQLSEHCEQSIG